MLNSLVRPHPNPFLEGEEDVTLTPYEREWSEGKKNIKFAGGSPAAGNFLLRRQKKVTKEKGAPDSDSRSVEREGAQAAARNIVIRGAIAAAPAPQASLTVSRQPPVRCPFGVPCAARPSGRLRNSRFALRQCSPISPRMGCAARQLTGDSKNLPLFRAVAEEVKRVKLIAN